MATEVWFRNPHNFIRELVEVGYGKITWDRGILVKKRIDPVAHAHVYYGQAIPYRILIVGDQGTAELRPGDTMDKPTAVYPTWEYGEDSSLLEEIVEQPVGNSPDYCSDLKVPRDERPVFGQEHRVIVTGAPPIATGPGRRFLIFLKELQEDNPNCIIHIHGLYGYRPAFGSGLRSADMDPRTVAQKGKVTLGSGKEERFENVARYPQWVTPFGFKPTDLAIPRNRCIFNIKSAIWAGQNYAELVKFKTVNDGQPVDTTSPSVDFKIPETNSHMSGKKKAQTGDQFVCETCTLAPQCKYYRDGAVCSVPGAEPTPLARYFGSRDTNMIMDGLGKLLQSQAARAERGLQEEMTLGGIDPEVSKIVDQVFKNGVKLAQLQDPSLRGGPKVQVNVGSGGQASISSATPQQLIAATFRELEAQGIPRERITSEMVQGVLTGMANPETRRRAIESEVIERRDEPA
jgi:hypothetical protein